MDTRSMFDTMTMTKVVASLCGALLFLLLGNTLASALYSVGGGHGGDEPAYVVSAEAAGGGDAAEAEPEESFEDMMAAADAEKGAKVFSKCKSCHKLESGKNGTGPYLNGVVGRAKGGADGFKYSDAITGLGGNWTPEDLNEFLIDTKAYAPGNKMSFKGLKKPADRANLIAYLETVQ